MTDLPRHGFVSTATVAAHINMTASYVRHHATELGGHRFGTSLRFDVRNVRAWIDERRLRAELPNTRRRPGPKPGIGCAIPADVRDW